MTPRERVQCRAFLALDFAAFVAAWAWVPELWLWWGVLLTAALVAFLLTFPERPHWRA
jgi:hypothetical protein